MMPMKVVTVRRWEVGTAFVALTIVFVIGLVAVTHIGNEANQAANRADKIAKENSRLIFEINKDRRTRAILSYKADLRACHGRHRIVNALKRIFKENNIHIGKIAHRQLKLADCRKVIHLLPIKPPISQVP